MPIPSAALARLAQYNASTAAVSYTFVGPDGYGYVNEWPNALHDVAEVGNWIGGISTDGLVSAITAFGADNVLVRSDGTGRALQATGVTVDDSNNVVLGHNAALVFNNPAVGAIARLQLHGTETNGSTIAQFRWQDTVTSCQHYLNHSRGTAPGQHVLLQNGDSIGSWIAAGSDGVGFQDATSIQSTVDGDPSAGNMPAALNFRTNSGGTATSIKARLTAAGQWLVGHVVAILVGSTSNQTPKLQVHGTGTDAQIGVFRWSDSNGGANLGGAKSRGTAPGVRAIVHDGDILLNVQGYGDDGTNFPPAGFCRLVVEGSPGAGDMPGAWVIGTTPDGSASPVEQLRVKHDGTLSHRNNAQTIVDANSHLQLRSYTVGSLPSAAVAAQLIFVSNESGGAVAAFSDGTNWRRMTDRAVVS